MHPRVVAGWALGAIAAAMLVVVAVVPADSIRETLLGVAALLGGLGMSLVLLTRAEHKLDDVNRPADEAYDAGHDDGYEKGWRDHARRALRVVNIQDRRRKGDEDSGTSAS